MCIRLPVSSWTVDDFSGWPGTGLNSSLGIGERTWTPHQDGGKGFVKPDLSVLDIDLTGVFYTVSLAIQQMRRQEPDQNGFRGKSKSVPHPCGGEQKTDMSVQVGCVASVCGFYCVPTLPVYTAAKQ